MEWNAAQAQVHRPTAGQALAQIHVVKRSPGLQPLEMTRQGREIGILVVELGEGSGRCGDGSRKP